MQPVTFFNKLNEEGAIIKQRLDSLKTSSVYNEGVLRLWEEGKLLCPDWERDRLWLNVIGHMATVAFLAERLALLLLTKNIPINVIEVVQAGLVHDWEKRLETDAGDEAKKGGADVVKAFIGVERAGYTRVRGYLGEKVAYYIGAAGGSGIDRLEKGSMVFEEKLMFYSDYCSSGSTIGTLTKRFDDLAPHYASGGRYAEVEARAQRRWGMSERQKLESLLIPIERQFAAIMDISDHVNLPLEVSKI